MPVATLDGIETRYETYGSGPAILMFAPGGFDATLENWTRLGRYADLGFIEAFSPYYTCVVFDRRESGESGGRFERLTWDKYVTQALALLDHLDIDRAHLMGGCVGCSTAAATAIKAPHRVTSLVLFSPAGGYTYRRAQHKRFAQHLGFALNNGLDSVVSYARLSGASFSEDAAVGPWAAPLCNSDAFAAMYGIIDKERYYTVVSGSVRTLFDRDTVPGVEPEDLAVLDVPALVVPGDDLSHTRSAAHYLHECLARSEFWDVPVGEQTPLAAQQRVLDFLDQHQHVC
jgi:pimeloyl-ACP methyl ester carboxylesterase